MKSIISSAYVLCLGDQEGEIRQNLEGLARRTPLEDFNNNGIILDVDGNSWSDR